MPSVVRLLSLLRRHAVAVPLAVAVVASSSGAFASDESEQAEQRFREGVQRFARHEYDAAATSFREAWALSKQERFLWNVALSELNAGDYVDAYAALQRCIQDDEIDEAHRKQIAAALDYVRGRVALIAIEAPSGAAISVDGTAVGVAPLSAPIAVEPTKAHTASAAFGSERATKELEPGPPGVTLDVRLLEPPPSLPLTKTAVSTSNSEEAAPSDRAGEGKANVVRVAVSGSTVLAGAAFGVSALVLYLNGRSERSTALALGAQAEAEQPTLPSSSACFGITSRTCANLDAANKASVRDANLAIDFGITAGGLVAAGAAAYFLWPKAATHVTVVPRVDRSSLGTSISVPF